MRLAKAHAEPATLSFFGPSVRHLAVHPSIAVSCYAATLEQQQQGLNAITAIFQHMGSVGGLTADAKRSCKPTKAFTRAHWELYGAAFGCGPSPCLRAASGPVAAELRVMPQQGGLNGTDSPVVHPFPPEYSTKQAPAAAPARQLPVSQ